MQREAHWLDESLMALSVEATTLGAPEIRRFCINVAGAVRQMERRMENLKDRQRQTAAELRILKRNRPGIGAGPLFEATQQQEPQNHGCRAVPIGPPPQAPGMPARPIAKGKQCPDA